MASRPLVSYDDITLPYDGPVPNNPQPPNKKRKRNNRKKQSVPPPAPSHWDDPTLLAPDPEEEGKAMDDVEESRELAHEEIWDDSALIQAWNAAMEEYEAYHGPDKGWKKEPVHRSPLWYNVPPKNPPKKSEPVVNNPQADESDSKPIDFDSFVPTHDASLSAAVNAAEGEGVTPPAFYTTPLTSQPHVSRDEAFERAVQASYWSGYWTAVYHCHRQAQTTHPKTNEAEDQDTNSSDEEGVEEFVSTQR